LRLTQLGEGLQRIRAAETNARGGGAAWPAHGGREGQVARGAAAAGAVGTDGGAVGTTPRRTRRGKWPMGRLSEWVWAGTIELG
jgi:hypothetical protein